MLKEVINVDAIIVKNLTKTYKKKNYNIDVLKNLNVKFSYGKLYLIIGHSGSGKSTLLRILGLIDKPDKGQINILGNDVIGLSEKDLANMRNNEIGFIIQDFLLDKHLTAKENVIIPMLINKNYKNRVEINKRASELLKRTSLSDRENHYPKELSGGEQQRVAISRALANNPNIILADEPTGNLDKENEIKIFEILRSLSSGGKCVIVVSHSSEILKYADVIYNLDDGILEKSGEK